MTTEAQATVLQLVLATLTIPFAGGIVCLLMRRRMSWLSPVIASLLLLISVVLATTVFLKCWPCQPFIGGWTWFSAGTVDISASILIDNLSVLMLVVVALISFLIHVFSIGYMVGDTQVSRYFAGLGFFTFSMLGLVTSGNLLLTFCFWELVGTGSYFLIGHWNERPKAAAAATKSFLMNRIGDAGFVAGMAIIWAHTGSLDFNTLANAMSSGEPWVQWAGLGLFLGAIGKSAQFPLLTWLPDAMEGPTPVSALIHAATMVAAGVFLLLRLQFAFTSQTAIVISLIGAVSALYAAVTALFQYDLKRILAYSTVSQLGVMMMGVGAQLWNGALFHLITHAFFKACLFLAAGSVIHGLQHIATREALDPQDIRNMGGLRRLMPNTFIAFATAAAALAGLPFFSGFLSKEAILSSVIDKAVVQGSPTMWIIAICLLLTSFLTVLYSYRMVSTVFFGDFNMKGHASGLSPTPLIMQLPTAILAILSIWIFYSINPFGGSSWLAPSAGGGHPTFEAEVVLLSIGWTIVSVIAAYWMYTTRKVTPSMSAFNLDKLYDLAFVTPVINATKGVRLMDQKLIDNFVHGLAYGQVILAKTVGLVDRVLIDGLVTLLYRTAGAAGTVVRRLGVGKIQSFIFWTTAALIIFILWQLK